MCCFAEFVAKYALIIVNIVFCLAGLAIIALGTAAHIQLDQIHDLIPVNLSALSISIIVLGSFIFIVSYCACCGAIRESRCMLVFYAVIMAILASVKIYITVVIFRFLDTALSTVSSWLNSAFNNTDLRPAYYGMENLFRCCGTTGSNSYTDRGEPIPPSCCGNLNNIAGNTENLQCAAADAFSGCTELVGEYFETFGAAIGGVLIFVIIIELICVIFGLFLACQIRRKRYTA
uniref:Tetraspanin n=1 Tax=Heliothis virescens TaxID=7102 RepID=A0A2A4K689_HELVI